MTESTSAPGISATDQAHIEVWRTVYDHLYGAPWGPLGEDFTGWDSTYDGAPLPVEQMREWRDTTVARALELGPRRVVELGVGSGLLLTAIAPHCTHYLGTDVSDVAVRTLGERLRAERPDLLERVELNTLPAHQVDRLPAGQFDLVVLNSVVQYFPNSAHLARVLTCAASLVGPSGALFVGDVRNARLADHFATAVASARGATATELPAAARAVAARDHEMLVDPAWFTEFADQLDLHLQVRLKHGAAINELTRYRYDVVLAGKQRPALDPRSATQLRWGRDVTALDQLPVPIEAPLLRLVGVPNRRLTGTGPEPDRIGRTGSQSVLTWSDADLEAFDVLLADETLGEGLVRTSM